MPPFVLLVPPATWFWGVLLPVDDVAVSEIRYVLGSVDVVLISWFPLMMDIYVCG